MKYSSIISLEHTVLVKVASLLWDRDVFSKLDAEVPDEDRGIARALRYRLKDKQWLQIITPVLEKVSVLDIPEPLKEKLRQVIPPVGLDILHWTELHELITTSAHYDMKLRENLHKLYWTAEGTIDGKRSVLSFGSQTGWNKIEFFRLLCMYYFEDDLRKLTNEVFLHWDPHPNTNQYDYIMHIEVIDRFLIKAFDINNWQDCAAQFHSPQTKALLFAGLSGNKPAAVHYFHKLTSEERKGEQLKDIIMFIISQKQNDKNSIAVSLRSRSADVFCFLFSQMNKAQQMQMFEEYGLYVLKILMNWPWQCYFMKTATIMWPFINNDIFVLILSLLIQKVIDGFTDYSYTSVFREFWQKGSTVQKNHVFELHNLKIFNELLKINDMEIFLLILNEATEYTRSQMLYSSASHCADLIHYNKWDELKFLIHKCFTSRGILVRFRKCIKREYFTNSYLRHVKKCWDEAESKENFYDFERNMSHRMMTVEISPSQHREKFHELDAFVEYFDFENKEKQIVTRGRKNPGMPHADEVEDVLPLSSVLGRLYLPRNMIAM